MCGIVARISAQVFMTMLEDDSVSQLSADTMQTSSHVCPLPLKHSKSTAHMHSSHPRCTLQFPNEQSCEQALQMIHLQCCFINPCHSIVVQFCTFTCPGGRLVHFSWSSAGHEWSVLGTSPQWSPHGRRANVAEWVALASCAQGPGVPIVSQHISRLWYCAYKHWS